LTGEGMSPAPDRISTGSVETDSILHGGFPRHSINVVMGGPGTGKTVLVQQLLFHNAAADRPVAYLSTISEPLAKVLSYLQRLDFYREDALLESMIYEDIGKDILADGPEELVRLVEQLIRRRGPRLLAVDSFKAVHDLTTSAVEVRRLCFRLAALLSAYDITTFLIGEYAGEDVARLPEFAIADGIVQLERRGTEKADERYLRVLKLRGSGYAPGLHAFQITSAGVEAYPRLVTPDEPTRVRPVEEQVGTGVEGLDTLTGGGLWRGSTTLVMGASGTGKTTLGLQFALEGVRTGERTLFLNLQEGPTQLAQTIRALGVECEDYRARGFFLQYESPVELRIDALVVRLSRMIEEHGLRRVVIDGLTEVSRAATSEQRFHEYAYALTQHFRSEGVTAMLTMEGASTMRGLESSLNRSRVSSLCDGLIMLENAAGTERGGRWIRVVKMRRSHHPLEGRPFIITDRGLRVEATSDA
jgi:circadian clock protein KaiC